MKQGGSQMAGFAATASSWVRRNTASCGTFQAGFTIVETMIVLAVTGSMLIMAITFIGGRQNKTQFQTSINGTLQQLQQIINETRSGYYPNLGTFTCNGIASSVVLSAGSTAQGANAGCIFLGKVVQFGTGSGDLASELGIIPVVGKQYSSGTVLVQQVSAAKPRALYPVGGETIGTNSIDTELMQYGLSIAPSTTPVCGTITPAMCYKVGILTKQTGSLGIIAGDSSGALVASDSAGAKPGFQQFSLYGVKSSTPGQDVATVASAIGNVGALPQGLESAQALYMCVASGTTDQSGLFTITNDLHVSLKIYRNLSCS